MGRSVKKGERKNNDSEKRFLSPRFSPIFFSLAVFRDVLQLTVRRMEDAKMRATNRVNYAYDCNLSENPVSREESN